MSGRFTVGIDYTTDTPRIYIKSPDGKIHHFTDGRAVGEVIVGLISAQRHFIHPQMFDRPPGDRQIKEAGK